MCVEAGLGDREGQLVDMRLVATRRRPFALVQGQEGQQSLAIRDECHGPEARGPGDRAQSA